MRFINDDELGARAEKLETAFFLLDVIGRDDSEGMPFENRL